LAARSRGAICRPRHGVGAIASSTSAHRWGAQARGLPCPAIVRSNDERHWSSRSASSPLAAGLAKGKQYLIGTRPAWRHHLTFALAFSRRAGGASELLTWRARAQRAIGKDRIFPREFPAAASVTAPGCQMCFLRRPGEAVASVVHPPQTLSLVPTEVHGFSASH